MKKVTNNLTRILSLNFAPIDLKFLQPVTEENLKRGLWVKCESSVKMSHFLQWTLSSWFESKFWNSISRPGWNFLTSDYENFERRIFENKFFDVWKLLHLDICAYEILLFIYISLGWEKLAPFPNLWMGDWCLLHKGLQLFWHWIRERSCG